MPMSSAERVKAMRERRALEAKRFEHQTLARLFPAFNEWLASSPNGSNYDYPLDNAGLDPVGFNDDSGGESRTGLLEQALTDSGQADLIPVNSLQRAELLVECWLDAASELAGEIKEFKRQHLTARLAELQAEPSTEGAQSEVELLQRLLSSLEKDVRRVLPNWRTSAN